MCAPGKSDGSLLSLSSRFPRFLAAGIISQDNVLCIIVISTESGGTEKSRNGSVQVWQEGIKKAWKLYGAPMEDKQSSCG